MNFENIVIFLPNDNRVLNFVPNVINLIYFHIGKSTNRPEVSFKAFQRAEEWQHLFKKLHPKSRNPAF